MALGLEEVRRLAELARLDLTTEEAEKAGGELERILEYVDRLQKIDTAHVPESDTEPAESLRPDRAREIDEATRQLILSNFPDRTGDALRVPAVFENPKG